MTSPESTGGAYPELSAAETVQLAQAYRAEGSAGQLRFWQAREARLAAAPPVLAEKSDRSATSLLRSRVLEFPPLPAATRPS